MYTTAEICFILGKVRSILRAAPGVFCRQCSSLCPAPKRQPGFGLQQWRRVSLQPHHAEPGRGHASSKRLQHGSLPHAVKAFACDICSFMRSSSMQLCAWAAGAWALAGWAAPLAASSCLRAWAWAPPAQR